MGFDEFLKKMGMTAAAYNELPTESKDYIQTSYYLTNQNAAKAKKLAEEKAQVEKETSAKAEKEKEKQKQKEFYDKWNNYFKSYSGNLADEKYKVVAKGASNRQKELTAERREQALAVARKNCKGHPEKLLFAEADALEASLKLESWERGIPVGDDFYKAVGDVKYTYSVNSKNEKKSPAEIMQSLEPTSVDYAMYSRLLARYDDDEGKNFFMENSADAIARDIYKNNPDALEFYEAHRDDNEKYANAENLDFTMNEIFRMGERMSRNSRSSRPMKELCAKIKSLQTDYGKNKEKYMEMPRGQLNNLMSVIMSSADAYVNDKKNLKSFSSTQLERLKCVNHLKTLQEAFMPNAKRKDFAYDTSSTHLGTTSSYLMTALAEKIITNSIMNDPKQAADLCDRQKMLDRMEKALSPDQGFYTPYFHPFIQDAVNKVRAVKGQDYPLDKIYMKLLKTDGKKLAKSFDTFFNQLAKDKVDNMFKEGKNKEKKEPAKKTGGMGMQ